MQKLVWKDAYEIGIQIIDDQHKKLINIINDLYDANTSGSTHLILETIFKQLADYVHYHFSTEEDMFQQYGYPKAKEHMSEHDDFRNKIKSLQEDNRGGNIVLSLKTIDFLKDWTINHILGTDREFSNFIKSVEM